MSWQSRFDQSLQDVRYALRGFRRNPGFTCATILTIAIGVGATTSVFSAVDRILFRSLPYPGDDRLVSVGMGAPIADQEFVLGSDYMEWRARQTPFELIATWTGIVDCDLTDQQPQRLSCAQVERTFLPTLGIRPMLGRDFEPAEDAPSGPRVAILSYGLWQARFNRDPAILGKSIPLDGQPSQIVGVLPPDFEFPTLAKVDVLVPQAINEAAQRRPATGAVLRAFARLKPGVSVEQAKAQMEPLFQESLNFVPAQFRKEVRLRVRSWRDRQTHDARLISWVLLSAAAAVLLIACANAANLWLARSVLRQKEWAVRAALGAGTFRLARQGITESLLAGLAGGVAGTLLALALIRFFSAIAPDGIIRLDQAGLDLRVLWAALLASLAAGILPGLVAVLLGPRTEALRGGRERQSGPRRFKFALVAFQIASSLVLVTGSALLLRSLWNLQHATLGLQTDNLMVASISLGRNQPPASQLAFFEELESKVERIPGVSAVAVSDSLPPGGQTRTMLFAAIDVEGQRRFAEGTGGMVVWRSTTPGYFEALRIPLLQGRGFEEQDRNPSAAVVVLSQTLAKSLFPEQEPLGRRIRPGRSGPWLTVIGVAGNVKNAGLGGLSDPEYYLPRWRSVEDAYRRSALIVRTSADPATMTRLIRSQVAELNSALPVTIETMGQRVGKLSARPRFQATLLSLFAGAGLLLAAVGLYGVLAFLFAHRTAEIGVRLAVGATPSHIRRLVFGSAIRCAAAGILLGVAGAMSVSRYLRTLLYQVPDNDPQVLVGGVAVLLVAALGAAWAPANRSSKVDPVAALRSE